MDIEGERPPGYTNPKSIDHGEWADIQVYRDGSEPIYLGRRESKHKLVLAAAGVVVVLTGAWFVFSPSDVVPAQSHDPMRTVIPSPTNNDQPTTGASSAVVVSPLEATIAAPPAAAQPPAPRSAPGVVGAPPPVSGMQIPPATDPDVQPTLPASAHQLGGVSLERYCLDGWGLHAVLRFPNTWGWRCAPSTAPAEGNRLGDQYISVEDACHQQYSPDAIDHYSSYTDPQSWSCWAE